MNFYLVFDRYFVHEEPRFSDILNTRAFEVKLTSRQSLFIVTFIRKDYKLEKHFNIH